LAGVYAKDEEIDLYETCALEHEISVCFKEDRKTKKKKKTQR
jgi:hypothetical protein